MRKMWEKWGYAAVLIACLVLIVGAALLPPKEKAAEDAPFSSPSLTVTPTETPSPSPSVEAEEKREGFILCLPADGEVLRGFAEEELNIDPISGEFSAHDGVDFAGEEGDKVLCAADGVVERVWESEKYGLCVEVAHRGGYFTRYASLSVAEVREGDRVKAGQVLGRMGSCLWEHFPHLHFSLRRLSRSLDPMQYRKDGF